LRLQSEIDQVSNELNVTHRLHEATHVAKHSIQTSVTFKCRQCWHDGVVRFLAWCRLVWMICLQRKVEASVLQRETRFVRHHTCAKTFFFVIFFTIIIIYLFLKRHKKS
jgi:hypothetical protein